jgi:23S rRNA pseudouridine2605 synthase
VTPDQLASARAAHWRENAQPILTLDDAKAWLERMQLCLYLPRKTQILAPAPSFVGAVLGNSSATPPQETIQQAHDFLVRLVVEGFVVPLNLFGTPGEQPDFLVVTSALANLAALQADRNWKKPPARTGPGKVSPLAVEIWKLLEREGVLAATEIREQLGHELTEAATIRGLSELWQSLRVAPLPQPGGEPCHWEILSVTHKKQMAKGSTMSQSTALSLLVSDYVQSVLTATAEDVEAFLSPVASRSRLRDVIRGLGATRQLKTLSMDAQTFLFVEGTLPVMPEAAAEPVATDKPAFMGRSAYRERMLNKTKDDGKVDEKTEDTSPRTYSERRGETGTDRPRTGTDRPSRSGAPRRDTGRDTGSREGGASRPSRFGAGGSSRPARPSFGDRARGTSSRPPFRRSEGDGGADRPGFDRSASAGRPPRPSGARPFTPREGARPPFRGKPAGGSDRPFRPRGDGDRPRPGGDRPFRPRTGDDRPRTGDRPYSPRPFTPREDSSRPPFRGKPAGGSDRPFRPRSDGDRPRPGGDRPFRPSTGGRPRPERSGGEGRPFTPRPFTPRGGSSRPPFRGKPAAAGDRPFRPRPASDRPFRPRPDGDRPRPDSRERPAGGRSSYPRREGSGRPSSGRPSSGRPSSGRPNSGRPGPGLGRPSRPSGSFTRRDGPPSAVRPSSGRPPSAGRPSFGGRSSSEGRGPGRPSSSRPSSGRPSSGGSFSGGAGRSSGRPPARPGSRPGTPGRNPGGTGRPGGPRPGSGSPRPGGSRPSGGRPGSSRPGGMRPPTRKPKRDDA